MITNHSLGEEIAGLNVFSDLSCASFYNFDTNYSRNTRIYSLNTYSTDHANFNLTATVRSTSVSDFSEFYVSHNIGFSVFTLIKRSCEEFCLKHDCLDFCVSRYICNVQ